MEILWYDLRCNNNKSCNVMMTRSYKNNKNFWWQSLLLFVALPVTFGYLFVWFDSFHPINNLSVIKGWFFLGWTSTKLGIKFLAKGHNTVTLVRLEPAAPWSRVKHSTTEPLRSLSLLVNKLAKLHLCRVCVCIHDVHVWWVWLCGGQVAAECRTKAH